MPVDDIDENLNKTNTNYTILEEEPAISLSSQKEAHSSNINLQIKRPPTL